MKVSINWLKELVDLKSSVEEVINLLPLRTVGTKEVTSDFFELDMKGYNRADLLSMRGVAYEVAAITDSKVNFQEESEFIWHNLKLPETKVKVEDPELAPFYCIAKIEGLKVSKSSENWVNRLSDCGVRSVNNVADITNLIMLEYGQPLHAFDASKIKDETLIVRCAKKDEEVVTLDEKTRKLSTSDLLITDPEKAVGIAGVMGGKNSEVSDSTTTILLEAAIFDPGNLRKTVQRLNLPSEASKRFQHGLTKKRALQALDAAIKMYESLGGKLTALSITGNLEDPQKTIKLNHEHLNSLIGVNIPATDMEKYLTKLNFKVASTGDVCQGWKVIPPYFRLDIEIEADVIEEIARMYGYDKIPAKKLIGEIPVKIDQSFFESIYKLKTTLVDLGLTEIQTYSFYSTQIIENLKLKIENLIHIANPMSAETEYMRNYLWPNLLEATAKNIRQGYKDIAIFEIGKVYSPQEGKLPKETYHLSITLSNGTDNPIQELHQIFQEMSKQLGHPGVQTQVHPWGGINVDVFHPTRFATLEKDGKNVGTIAEIHPRFVNKFGIDQRVAVLEISITEPQLPLLKKRKYHRCCLPESL